MWKHLLVLEGKLCHLRNLYLLKIFLKNSKEITFSVKRKVATNMSLNVFIYFDFV